MKAGITPRTWTHGDFRNSPFVEMRYVRFDRCCVEAAVLLAVFEEASLPLASNLRDVLRARRLSPQLAQYLHLTLTCKLHTFVSAWNNSGEFLAAVSEWWRHVPTSNNLRDMGQVLQEVFGMSVEWDSANSFLVLPTISMFLRKENEIVLFYKYYCENSFLKAPCGHLHLVYRLFEKVSHLAQGSLHISSLQKFPLQCTVEDCQRDLSEFFYNFCVMDSAEKTSEEETWLTRVRLPARECCQIRPVKPTAFHCDHGMCRNCLMIAVLSAPPYCCYSCRAPMRMKYLEIPKKLISEVKVPPILLTCRQCGSDLELDHYSKVQTAGHICWICNNCLGSSSFCPNCNTLVETLRIDVCEICETKRSIYTFFVCCQLEHRCFYCDACAFEGSLALPPNCAQCRKMYSEREKNRVPSEPEDRLLTSIVCLRCKTDRSISDYTLSTQLSHWWKCRVCDDCSREYRSTHSRICLVCKKSLSERDLEIIDNHFSG